VAVATGWFFLYGYRQKMSGAALAAGLVVSDTRGIGWGFHDELAELFGQLLWN
jgi:hypothetical protein